MVEVPLQNILLPPTNCCVVKVLDMAQLAFYLYIWHFVLTLVPRLVGIVIFLEEGRNYKSTHSKIVA
jgi:hypothetical protein